MNPASGPSDRLDSWKEIAAYLGRTEKTARRWEQTEGLPVHRHLHAERGSVYAYRHELDAWREQRTSRAPMESSPADPTGAPPARASDRRRWLGIGAGVLVALAVSGALWLAWSDRPVDRPQVLAVLPFAIDRVDESGSDLGLAMAESIVGHLAGATDLRVRPFESSLRHSQGADEPAVVGTRIGADVLATGRVRTTGEGLSIQVALVDVPTNSQVWSMSYESGDRDLGRTQERIALDVREQALRHAHGPRYQPATYQPSNPLSRNPEALRLYLRARGFRNNPGRAPIQTSIAYLLDAIRLDPDFTRAYGALAVTYTVMTFLADSHPADTIGQAKVYASRALALDPNNAAAHMALAGVSHWHDFDHERAEVHFRAAFAADPELAGARLWYAEMLFELRRFDEALEASAAAAARDPGWLSVDVVRANVYLFSGRPEQAIPIYLRALDSEPNHGLLRHFLGQAYLATGQVSQAIDALRHADALLGHVPFSRARLGHALARAGHRGEAEAILAELMAARAERFAPAFAVAAIHAGLGSPDLALDWLERAADEQLLGYHLPSVDLMWAPLRAHPRFRALLRRLNLPDDVR